MYNKGHIHTIHSVDIPGSGPRNVCGGTHTGFSIGYQDLLGEYKVVYYIVG